MSEIIAKGYKIVHSNYADYKFSDLPEELCQKLCDVEDRGNRWSEDSRYIWSCGNYDGHNGIPFGTAKAVVQFMIQTKFSYPFKKFSIIKNQE